MGLAKNRKDYFKKEELIVNGLYECDARNFTKGRWNGKNFDYTRTKFNMKFPDTEQHWDEGAPFGTVKPFRLIEEEESDG